MAFFSLLEPDEANHGEYRVKRCHINVWSLPGWFGHRPMLLDVGLLFEADGPVRVMEMALPFGASPGARDLSDVVKNSDVAALLFGRSFKHANGHTLSLYLDGSDSGDATDIRIVGIDEKTSETQRIDEELSTAKLVLAPAPPSGISYARVRYIVDHPGTMWRWQRVLGRRNGLLIDFRVPDPREERHKKAKSLEGRAKRIDELDAFFMVPERFLLQDANPPLKYTRTLEGKAWHPYLRRSLHGLSVRRRNRQRLMVHRWHPESEEKPEAFERDHPFRGFLQFTREPAFKAPSDLLLSTLASAALFYAIFRPLSLRAWPRDAAIAVGNFVGGLASVGLAEIAALTLVGLAVLAWNLIRRVKKLPALMQRVKRRFKRIEYSWFNLLK